MDKKTFKGSFNVLGQVIQMQTEASTERKAFYNFIHQLSKKMNVYKFVVCSMFDGSKDNYLIEEVR